MTSATLERRYKFAKARVDKYCTKGKLSEERESACKYANYWMSTVDDCMRLSPQIAPAYCDAVQWCVRDLELFEESAEIVRVLALIGR